MKALNLPCLILSAFAFCGCESTVKYPPSANWGQNTMVLGSVKADSGIWSLSLNVPPPEYTYFAALRDKAASQFNVPADSIAIGEMTVLIGAELDGTIRDWSATAMAGQNTNAASK